MPPFRRFPFPFVRGRPFASQAIDPPKPKRKSTTPLRRATSESLPIRATRGNIQPIFTLSTAERYLLSKLRPRLPPTSQILHEAWWIPRWGERGNEGEIFVFGNGSFVCWGLGEKDGMRFADEVVKPDNVEIAPHLEAETEELEFVTDPTETTRLQGDLIILGRTSPLSSSDSLPSSLSPSVFPKDSLLARYAFSQALARSTALSALEESLDRYLSSVALLPHSLEKTGKPGMSRKELIKKLGELMKFRQGLNLNPENFSDTPDFYWAEPELEAFFNSLSDALEVKARAASVNDKITYAAETQSVLRQLLTESTTHRMELVIIVLIAVEVIVALIRDGPELFRMFVGPNSSSKASESGAENI